MRRFVRALSALGLLVAVMPLAALGQPESAPGGPTRALTEFGPITTAEKAQKAYAAALDEMKKSGGVLVVPGSAWKLIKDLPLQGLTRTPAGPSETKQWKTENGVTVVVTGDQFASVQVPPLTGLHLDRHLRLREGDSLPHWGTHPMLTLDNQVTYGSTSYLDWIQAPVTKGLDRRFYVATIRGLRPSMFVNIHGGPGYGGGVTRACIKSLGFDADKNMPFIVADTSIDHKVGAILHNKSNTGLIHMLQTSNSDNQTYDVKVIRNQYSHGDAYVYYCDFNYMSNVHSAAGDENGNCYAAFIRSKDDNFQSTVESVDWEKNELKFAAANRNIQTLGDSRPVINLNPKKAITAGKVLIVPAECYWEPTDTGKCQFEGKTYPSRLIQNPVTGNRELKMGGLIRGDKDCPWTSEVVGRFFAVSTPEEKTPRGVLRWYLITSLRESKDGTKEIEIQRFWWGAKNAGSPTLYSPDSYSLDGRLHPLDYIIAPGTYVNDVSHAIPGGDRGGQRILGLAPYRDQGSPFDFAKGDAIEQAIGPDPFKPQAFRVWMWEDVPGVFPAAVFDLANNGASSRFSAMTIAGGGATMEDVEKRRQKKPAWDNAIVFNAAIGVGLNCKADFADAAILFHQPTREQPIKWRYDKQEGQPLKEAALTVSRTTGELTFKGGGVRTGRPRRRSGGTFRGQNPGEKPARQERPRRREGREGRHQVPATRGRRRLRGLHRTDLVDQPSGRGERPGRLHHYVRNAGARRRQGRLDDCAVIVAIPLNRLDFGSTLFYPYFRTSDPGVHAFCARR